MINVLIFLTLNIFNLVVGSYSTDSQVAEIGNDRLFVEALSLHSGDSLGIEISALLFTIVLL